MKLFFDTEFTGLTQDTTLISLGIISEYGNIFYAEFNDYNKDQVNEWIEENVISNLKYNNEETHLKEKTTSFGEDLNFSSIEMKGNNEEVKEKLTEWLSQYSNIEWVSDVCHYDMVLLVNIFGSAFDTPFTPVCYDINQDIASYLNIDNNEAFDVNREEFLELDSVEDEDIILSDVLLEPTWDSVKQELLNEGSEIKHNALWDAMVIRACHYKML